MTDEDAGQALEFLKRVREMREAIPERRRGTPLPFSWKLTRDEHERCGRGI
jgi:hypothetical protein